MTGTDGLQRRLLRFIVRGAGAPPDAEEFEGLALRIFAFQYATNPIYRGFCDARGASPDRVATSAAIPAVPTEAFRAAPLVCGDPEQSVALFRTSGTTGGREARGEHHFLDLAIYRASLLAGFRHHLLPDRSRMRTSSLLAAPEEVPDSSLGYMIGAVMEEMGSEGSGFDSSDGEVRVDAFLRRARRSAEEDVPLLVVGTSFAFVHLLDTMRERDESVRLRAGSRVMDTGGFKGRSREVSRADLYAGIEERLGVPSPFIINEYGMTELSSQRYDGRAGTASADIARRRHAGPPWLRTTAVDTETLAPLPEGETGILRHLDLANLHSVAAVQTADLGRVVAGEVELFGRAPGAEPRGCSMAMEDLLEVVHSSPQPVARRR